MTKILPHSEWQSQVKQHQESIDELVSAWRQAKNRQEKHPVIDFLFRYYSFPYNKLKSWTPGINIQLEGPLTEELSAQRFEVISNKVQLKAELLPSHRLKAVDWTLSLLKKTIENQSCFNCYGLHEWAMIYKAEKVRHEYTSLRLPDEQINSLIEESKINCTHFDALRFYTAAALPLNKHQPTRQTQEDFEQSACLHANMDLYKWAYKMYPWVSSNLMLKCFKLAFACREVDMKASPYDLRYLGYEPIKVETPEGREVYVKEQLRLKNLAAPLRLELLEVYSQIRNEILKLERQL